MLQSEPDATTRDQALSRLLRDDLLRDLEQAMIGTARAEATVVGAQAAISCQRPSASSAPPS